MSPHDLALVSTSPGRRAIGRRGGVDGDDLVHLGHDLVQRPGPGRVRCHPGQLEVQSRVGVVGIGGLGPPPGGFGLELADEAVEVQPVLGVGDVVLARRHGLQPVTSDNNVRARSANWCSASRNCAKRTPLGQGLALARVPQEVLQA